MATSEPEDASVADDLDWHCYKHPDRDAGVRCRRCERAICPDCMISAPVGFQCRECVKGAPPVRTLRSLRRDPYVTMALIAVNVAVFLPTMGGRFPQLGVNGPDIAAGEWWRIVTGGFIHEGLLHIGFNMFLLWLLGQTLEPTLGRVRFAVLYATSLLAGSLGVLLLDPNAHTGGASGAVFGLMGAGYLLQRRRGIEVVQGGSLGALIVINLLFSLLPGVSIGGHLGGLVGGGVVLLVLDATDGSRQQRWLGTAVSVALAAAVVGASLYVAANPL
jgi:membrane associated rhomboid family serine protease